MSNIYNVREFGAKGDGVTLDTEAIQTAINRCSERGGGVVAFPAGTYLSGTLFLKSHVKVEIGRGAVLLGSRSLSDYVKTEPGAFCRKHGFIRASNVENVSLCGPGVIDAAMALEEDGNHGPMSIVFEYCRDVTIQDILLDRSPGWGMWFLECEDLRLLGVTVLDSAGAGTTIVNCRRVLYDGCVIDGTFDDPLVIKNEPRPENPGNSNITTEDVIVSNTLIRNSSHPAIKIGTQTAGLFRNILVSNCIFTDVRTVFQIALMRQKLTETKERLIENVSFSNVIARNVRDVFDIQTSGVDEAAVSDLVFDNLLVSGMGQPSIIQGYAHVPIRNVTIKNSRFVHTNDSATTWLSTRHTEHLTVRDVDFDLRAPLERLVEMKQADGFIWDNVSIQGETVRDSVITMRDSGGAEVRNCVAKHCNTYVKVEEGGLEEIRFHGNGMEDVVHPIVADSTLKRVRPLADRVKCSVLEMDREIEPGERATIKVRLENQGSAGAFLVKATSAGAVLGGCWAFLRVGEQTTATFETQPIYRSGRYAIDIGGVEAAVVGREMPCTLAYPGPFELVLEEGKPEAAWVKVPVRNIGGQRGTVAVTLDAAGRVMRKEITLEPGESSFVTFDDFKGMSSIIPLKVGDYAPLAYYTYANTEGRFFCHRDGRIEIHAGGERGTFEQHAVVYLPRVAGDYDAVCRILHQDTHTGEYAGVGLVARNRMTDDASSGHVKYHRVIKYGGFLNFRADRDGDGKMDAGGGGGGNSRLPVWVKVEKRGNDFWAYNSQDGETWVENQALKGGKRKMLRYHYVLKDAADTQDVGVFGLAYGEGISRVIVGDFSVTKI